MGGPAFGIAGKSELPRSAEVDLWYAESFQVPPMRLDAAGEAAVGIEGEGADTEGLELDFHRLEVHAKRRVRRDFETGAVRFRVRDEQRQGEPLAGDVQLDAFAAPEDLSEGLELHARTDALVKDRSATRSSRQAAAEEDERFIRFSSPRETQDRPQAVFWLALRSTGRPFPVRGTSGMAAFVGAHSGGTAEDSHLTSGT